MDQKYKRFLFNRNPLKLGRTIEQPSQELVKNTLGLYNCSMEDAVKFGGDLTRAALGALQLKNDRKNIIVDVKVHMLMENMCPAIPSWHTDGVPRGANFNPQGKDLPNIWEQEKCDRPPHFHLLVTGEGCLTDFLLDPMEISIPDGPSSNLYSIVDQNINGRIKNNHTRVNIMTSPSCQWIDWDWYSLHTGVWAKKKEFRYLIRVCETDFQEPQKDLRNIIRTQQNVYCKENYGW